LRIKRCVQFYACNFMTKEFSSVSNIINNAVIYSPEQAGVEVELSDAMLTVHNTGVHIKDEDLEQLFIPFFRVDKSRNRNTGGSGLGLYIVKTIFDHHRISYKLGNTENGVKFTVGFLNKST